MLPQGPAVQAAVPGRRCRASCIFASVRYTTMDREPEINSEEKTPFFWLGGKMKRCMEPRKIREETKERAHVLSVQTVRGDTEAHTHARTDAHEQRSHKQALTHAHSHKHAHTQPCTATHKHTHIEICMDSYTKKCS